MTTLSRKKFWLGVGLIGLAGVFFAGMFVVGFLPLSVKARGGLALACFILMEVSFWLGSLILGKEVVTSWWNKWRKKKQPTDEAAAEAEHSTEADTPAN